MADEPDAVSATSFCRMCPALCGIEVTVVDGDPIHVAGDRAHLLSHGYMCPKGRKMGSFVDDPAVLGRPLMRGRDGELVEVDWDIALDDLAARLASIHADDPYAVGLYTGTILDSAGRVFADKLLTRLGSPSRYSSASVDSIAKVLVPKLMAGREGLNPAIDFDRTTLLVIIGENTVVSHGAFSYFPDPIRAFRRIADRGEIWAVDPRRTETARLAQHHLRPRIGTDFALVGHLVRELLRDGADHGYLAAHAHRVDELRRAVEPLDADTTSRITGLATTDLADLLAAVRHHRRLAVVTGTGVTMSVNGNVTEWLVYCLQIVTGSFERPGGRWFNHSAALRPSEHHAADGGFGPGSRTRPDIRRFGNQYPCAVMPLEIEAGHLRGLMVAMGNPLAAFPQPDRLRRAFERLEVLAVWDVVRSATVERATHVFPCPTPLERADLVTPPHLSAVYAQYTPPIVARRGQRRPMWWSFGALARRLGVELLPGDVDPDQCTDEMVFRELAAPTGIAWKALADGRPVPVALEERWVERTVLPDGRWDLAPAALLPRLDAALARPAPPIALGNRREVHHTNTTLTWGVGRAEPLVAYVYVSAADAEAAGVADGERVEVRSPHGAVTGTARIDPALGTGTVNVPHGFTEPHVGHLTATDVDVDPLTGMPTLVGVSITISRG